MNRQEVLSAALRTIVAEMEEKEAEGYRVRSKSRKQSAAGKEPVAVRKAEVEKSEDEIE